MGARARQVERVPAPLAQVVTVRACSGLLPPCDSRGLPPHSARVQLRDHPADLHLVVVGARRDQGHRHVVEPEHFPQSASRRHVQRGDVPIGPARPHHPVLLQPRQPPVHHRMSQPKHHPQTRRLKPTRPIEQLHDLLVPLSDHPPRSRHQPGQSNSQVRHHLPRLRHRSRPGPPDPIPRGLPRPAHDHTRSEERSGCVVMRARRRKGPPALRIGWAGAGPRSAGRSAPRRLACRPLHTGFRPPRAARLKVRNMAPVEHCFLVHV